MSNEKIVGPIIGADAELQSRMREQANANHSRQALASFESESRKNTRYEISNSIVCYPVLEGQEIDSSNVLVGIAVDISLHGMRVYVDSIRPSVGMEVLIGVELKTGENQFIGGVIASARKQAENKYEVGIAFRGYTHEVIDCSRIMPMLDREEMRFVLPYPESVLASLCKVRAAVSTQLDEVITCPNCRAIPTFRTGCSLCLSNNVRASRMIHHFACAHVDFVENFEQDNELCCQKCRTRRMIVGSDYEYLDGPNMCYDCGQANLEKIEIGHCLSCEHRFPSETAYHMKIVGYIVKRLDVLSFIGSH